MGPTAGEAAAAAPDAPTGCPVAPGATGGWSITPTMMASAPVALSEKVAAWANIVFMDQPSLFSLRRHAMRRFMLLFAGSLQTSARRGKAGKVPAQYGSQSILLATSMEIYPMIWNGGRE